MKKLLVVAAIATAASPAFASKARTAALGESQQLTDVQYVFEAPHDLGAVGELVTIEWGTSNSETTPTSGVYTNANPHAEGGFIKKHGDAWYGLYLGKQSEDFTSSVTADLNLDGAADATGLMAEQNPVNLLYSAKMGELTWGVNLKYSKGFDETAAGKATAESSGVVVGVTQGPWEVAVMQGLTGKSKNAAGTAEVKSKSNTKVAFGYDLSDAMYLFANYKTTNTDFTGFAANNVKRNIMNIGMVNTLVKADGVNFFYGVSYLTSETKFASTKIETTGLPVWLGVEADATSWMVMRAHVKQTVLINQTKNGSIKADQDNTSMAAGLGFKLGKGMLDATFTTATSGRLSFGGNTDGTAGDDSFLSQVSYTYNF